MCLYRNQAAIRIEGKGMRQLQRALRIRTRGQGMAEVTGEVAHWLAGEGAGTGLLTLFIRHTSASLAIQENADPTVQADLMDALDRLAPRSLPYRHATEGPDDMPAHVRAMLTGVSLQVPVAEGRMLLGTWQGIYVIEHRDRPHDREIVLHYCGT
ncbi:MAG: YjbQ family protein [Rhodobiaceae bacterium]|nr:secondary thiamine-phosphate synthase enzyme YjbQ [Rhodobiaceae bacterium]MCC0054008.1 YjbQ family protein [Rhodobiaceae bacterium]